MSIAAAFAFAIALSIDPGGVNCAVEFQRRHDRHLCRRKDARRDEPLGVRPGGCDIIRDVISGGIPSDATSVILGTATPGGGFPVYGDAVAGTINEVDPSLIVITRNTKGSTDNVPLLEAGDLDLGLVQGEVAHEALHGVGRPPADLRILAAMYSTPGMFVVRADSPYRTIDDLRGKPVAFGAKGSGLVILARYVLDGLGLDQRRDFQAVLLDRAGDGPAMVLDGRAAALWGGGVGWPGFSTVANGLAGARFIAPDAEGIRRIQARHPFLQTMVIAAGSYPGQHAPIVSVGSWSFILARATLPEDLAYRLARALHRGEAKLATRVPQARETTIGNTVAAALKGALIHLGVLRYLRETGMIETPPMAGTHPDVPPPADRPPKPNAVP